MKEFVATIEGVEFTVKVQSYDCEAKCPEEYDVFIGDQEVYTVLDVYIIRDIEQAIINEMEG